MHDPHLKALLTCLRFPSVSTDPDRHAGIQLHANLLHRLGDVSKA